MQASNRNVTLDVARGIGILTVVLCHNWILYHNRGELSRVVFSFHMPLFFFISGVFFNRDVGFKPLCITKASALLKPFYLVLTLVFGVSCMLVERYDLSKELLNILYSSGTTITWTPLWFLSHLFFIFIFAWVVERYVLCYLGGNLQKHLFILLMLFIGVKTIDIFFGGEIILFNQFKFRGLPFNLDILLVTTPFFLLGSLLVYQVKKFKPKSIWVLISAITFMSLHYFFNQTIELNARQYPHFLICTLQILTGIYLVFSLAYALKNNLYLMKPLAYMGSASLYILIFHFYPQHVLTGVLQYHFPSHLLFVAVVAMVVSIAVSLMLWEITLRSPFLKWVMLNSKR